MERDQRKRNAPRRLTYNAPGVQAETMATVLHSTAAVTSPKSTQSRERRSNSSRSVKSAGSKASTVMSFRAQRETLELEIEEQLLQFDKEAKDASRKMLDEIDGLNEELQRTETRETELKAKDENLTAEENDEMLKLTAKKKGLQMELSFKQKAMDKHLKRIEDDRADLVRMCQINLKKLQIIEEDMSEEESSSEVAEDDEDKGRDKHVQDWIQELPSPPSSKTGSYRSFSIPEPLKKDVIEDLRFEQSHPSPVPIAPKAPSSSKAADRDGVMLNLLQNQIEMNQAQLRFMSRNSGSSLEKKLPEFSGNPGDWSGFLETFQRTSTKFYMTDGENLARLREALKGEAREVVKHLLTKSTHVNKILHVLRERYGQPSLVIKWCLGKIRKCGKLDLQKPETLDKFGRSVEDWVMNVKSHKQTDHLRNTILLEELLEKLPALWAEQWYEHCIEKKPKELDLEDFSLWLEKKVGGVRMRMQAKWAEPKEEVAEDKKHRGKRGPAHAAPTADQVQEESFRCPYCGRSNHELGECRDFKRTPLKARLDFTRNNNLCYCCLKLKHHVKDCPEQRNCGTNGCTKKHHPLVHSDQQEQRRNDRPRQRRQTQQHNENGQDGGVEPNLEVEAEDVGGATYVKGTNGPLGVVEVKVRGANGKIIKTFALLDSGATSSYIESSLADELGLDGEEKTTTVGGIFGKKTRSRMKHVKLEISGTYRGARQCKLRNVRTAPDLGLPQYSLDVDEIKKKWPYLKRAKCSNIEKATIKIIVGEDHGFLSMHRQCLFKDEFSPVAKRTVLGWYISGDLGRDTDEAGMFAAVGLDDQMHQMMKDHFNIESFGVKIQTPKSITSSIEDKRAEATLDNTFRRTEDGCEVGLLWRNPEVNLPDSKPLALKRLQGMERKMARDPEFAAMYNAKFEEYKEKGYIRPVLDNTDRSQREWYIPHFGVTNPNKPDKLRLVFDAAAKSNGCSLNDHLLKGPDLNRPLTEVLWNFRRHKYVILGDIEDMFHRVKIREEDRASQRFLWREGDPNVDPITYEMNVMIFGATSSPTSAIYVKNQNAEEFKVKYPEAYRAITEDFYVDDCLTGADTEQEAMELYRDIVWVNRQANFNVKKWTSNSSSILSHIPEDMRSPAARDFNEKSEIPTERVLGLWWIPEEDVFTFKTNFHKVKPDILAGGRPTKREMCSLVMSMYDPIGFITHFKVKGLMLLQKTWIDNVGWDDEISDSVYEKWKDWVEAIPSIAEVKVKRHYSENVKDGNVQLHTFVDASEEAYAAVSYLRVEKEDEVDVSFMAAKARVAPLKKLTIPRMELMAALLGSRLAASVSAGLKVNVTSKHFWSDSSTVLSWIRSETARFKEFVANRVGEIQELTNPVEWKWIPTKENVADDATRFSAEADLSCSSRWLNGPSFLALEEEKWPRERVKREEIEDALLATIGEVAEEEKPDGEGEFEFHRFSSFMRMLRARAAVYASIRKWRHQEKCVNIKAEDMIRAEHDLVKLVQEEAFRDVLAMIENGKEKQLLKSRMRNLHPMLAADGLLRVKGRIGNANVAEDQRSPAILPPNHKFTQLLIQREHERNGHQGHNTILNNIRQQYWIIDGMNAVKKVARECLGCKRGRMKPIRTEMGNLPKFRLASRQPPFTFTGVDYFGPMEVTVGRHHEKRWGVLFTCMVTRAVHLEVAYGLSTDEFIMAFSRFVDARGRPKHMYSDNGTNFVGAAKELKEAFSSVDWTRIMSSDNFHKTEWHFNPPAAPHMGGVWERLVRSVKKGMQHMLKEKYPRDQTLLTAFKAVENMVNSRPLTTLSTDPTDPESLTPNHFLRGGSDQGPNILAELNDSAEFSRKQWKISQALTDKFWDRWSKEYLPLLLQRQRWHLSDEALEVGDLVFIVDDQQPRNTWMRAVVTRLFPGKDGQVRVVDVCTRNFRTKAVHKYRRPVSKLCRLGLRMDSVFCEESMGAGM